MNAHLYLGGNAAKASAIELATAAHASDNPVDFTRGVVTMTAGALAAVIGHEAVAQILTESSAIIRTAAEQKKAVRSV